MKRVANSVLTWPKLLGLALLAGAIVAAGPAQAAPCTVPDNGSGTANLPPANCGYVSPADLHMMINGLPPGTTITVAVEHERFFNANSTPGGPLGGAVETFGSQLTMHLEGTGGLSGYSRNIAMMNVQSISATAPRTPFQPIQSFDNAMLAMQGQLPIGDPDFDLLRITAGSAATPPLPPGPGHTTLTQVPGGGWAVDSFFDIFYEIEFIGKAGGPLSGMSGSTTGTIRMGAGLPACGTQPLPACNGTCPPNTTCQPGAAGHCNCVPVPLPCAQSPWPQCNGTCPVVGQTCEPDPTGVDLCLCTAPPPTCQNSPFPNCMGTCPSGSHCEPNTTGVGSCDCVPDVVPCSDSPLPGCLGTCPAGEQCNLNTAGVCDCEPIPCEDTEPSCDGPCPPGAECLQDPVGNCFCNPIPQCHDTFFPQCDGLCPNGQQCQNVPGTNNCDCFTPPPVCSASPFPGCLGTCPLGQECRPMADGTCLCVSPVPCNQTFHPSCNGNCPVNQECLNVPGTANCECRPLPPPVCSLAPFPACNGSCPAFQRCVKVGPNVDPPCRCEWCIIVVPGPDIEIGWVSKIRFHWTPGPCADWHNVYRATLARLTDANQDGVADDYGTCLAPDVPGLELEDTDVPPIGQMHIYLVTGENSVGEGSKGHTSSGLERPNVSPCP